MDHQPAPAPIPPILRLQPELGGMFSDEMDLYDLVQWRLTCRTNYHQAVGSMRRSLYNMLKPYVSSPVALLNIISKHRAVLGGEFALAFVLRDTSILSKHVDVYASNYQFDSTCSAIVNDTALMAQFEGYNLTTYSFVDALRTLTTSTLVIDTSRGTSIRIHQSYTASPSAPISRAPFTALSNFVSAHGFGCSHPLLTLNRRTLIADQELPDFASPDLDMEAKLRKHHFTLAVSPTSWPEFCPEGAPSTTQIPNTASGVSSPNIHTGHHDFLGVTSPADTTLFDSSLHASPTTEPTARTQDHEDHPLSSSPYDRPALQVPDRAFDAVTLTDNTSCTSSRLVEHSDPDIRSYSPAHGPDEIVDKSCNLWPTHSVAIVHGPSRSLDDCDHIILTVDNMHNKQRTISLELTTGNETFDPAIHPTNSSLHVAPHVDVFPPSDPTNVDNFVASQPSQSLPPHSNRFILDTTHQCINTVVDPAPPSVDADTPPFETVVYKAGSEDNIMMVQTTTMVGAGPQGDIPPNADVVATLYPHGVPLPDTAVVDILGPRFEPHNDPAFVDSFAPEFQPPVDTDVPVIRASLDVETSEHTADVFRPSSEDDHSVIIDDFDEPGFGDDTPTSESTFYGGDTEDDHPTPEHCLRHRFICPSQGRFFGDRGSFVDFFDPLSDAEAFCVQNNIPPFGPMVVWRVLSTFDCEEGCDIYDDVLQEGVTSIPVLFRKDPFGHSA